MNVSEISGKFIESAKARGTFLPDVKQSPSFQGQDFITHKTHLTAKQTKWLCDQALREGYHIDRVHMHESLQFTLCDGKNRIGVVEVLIFRNGAGFMNVNYDAELPVVDTEDKSPIFSSANDGAYVAFAGWEIQGRCWHVATRSPNSIPDETIVKTRAEAQAIVNGHMNEHGCVMDI